MARPLLPVMSDNPLASLMLQSCSTFWMRRVCCTVSRTSCLRVRVRSRGGPGMSCPRRCGAGYDGVLVDIEPCATWMQKFHACLLEDRQQRGVPVYGIYMACSGRSRALATVWDALGTPGQTHSRALSTRETPTSVPLTGLPIAHPRRLGNGPCAVTARRGPRSAGAVRQRGSGRWWRVVRHAGYAVREATGPGQVRGPRGRGTVSCLRERPEGPGGNSLALSRTTIRLA